MTAFVYKTAKIVDVSSNLSKLTEELNKRTFPEGVGKACVKGQRGVFLRQQCNPAFLQNTQEKHILTGHILNENGGLGI